MQSQSRLVYTIPQAAEAAQTGKTKLYAEIKAGRLPIVKVGRKTLIRHETLDKWLRESETLPVYDGCYAARGEASNV